MARLKTIRGIGYDGSKAQDNTSSALQTLVRDNPILDSNVVKARLVSSDTEVFHGLGREPVGWVVVDKVDNCNVWQSQTKNELRKKRLFFRSDVVGVDVSILFF